MNQETLDLYAALGLERWATPDQIEAAYTAWEARTAASEPPDKRTTERVRYAYEVLSNPQRRVLYDSLMAETKGTGVQLDLMLSTDKLPLMPTPQVVYALLTLTAREAKARERRPLNLGLIVDRSTSMRGERLAKVTAAVALVLEKLAPDDALSLVSFSDRAEVVLPAALLGAAGDSANRETLAAWHEPRRRLESIVASGGTEIFQGLRAGLGEVNHLADETRTSHLILLTDGHTYGDADDCLRLAAEAAGRGIGVTAFGLGADWNDGFLDALVAPSGGQSHFIEQPGDVLPHLETRLKGLGAIHARNVALQQNWPEQFALRSGFKLTPFPQPLAPATGPIPLGDLEGRAPLSVLLEFLVTPQTAPARFRLSLQTRYNAPGGEATAVRHAQFVVRESGDRDERPPAVLIEAARRLNLYRMQEKAWEEAQSGKLDTAAARMRRLTSRYLETGDLRLAKQAQLESQRLAHLGTMSLEGRKVLKYGTRSLMGVEP